MKRVTFYIKDITLLRLEELEKELNLDKSVLVDRAVFALEYIQKYKKHKLDSNTDK